ncbi:hypothetical protein [Streptomyces sp. NPDC047061]|uniref:hypothetical protein n=1 Tax=Streptomyces sp. NPDC047061 TaxID=3154605 RepID=UPI003400E61E
MTHFMGGVGLGRRLDPDAAQLVEGARGLLGNDLGRVIAYPCRANAEPNRQGFRGT